MTGPTLSLVQHGKARRLSGLEIQALTAERVAALKVRREEERAARAEELAAWRKSQAAKARARVRTWRLLGVLLMVVATQGLTPDGNITAGCVAFFLLVGWASYLALGVAREPYERLLAAGRERE